MNTLSLLFLACITTAALHGYVDSENSSITKEIFAKSEPFKAKNTAYSIIDFHQGNQVQVLSTSKPVIIDAYTDWCGYCKYLTPVINDLNHQYGHVYQFAKFNAEKDKDFTRSLGIRAFPTILFYKDGQEVGRHEGYLNKEAFLAKIEQIFNE